MKKTPGIQVPNKVIMLLNSHLFWLNHAFIGIDEDFVRLICIKNNKKIDHKYASIKNAKIAFSRYFGAVALSINGKRSKPEWSKFSYSPDDDWMERIEVILNKAKSIKIGRGKN